jgi:hypothetical protein
VCRFAVQLSVGWAFTVASLPCGRLRDQSTAPALRSRARSAVVASMMPARSCCSVAVKPDRESRVVLLGTLVRTRDRVRGGSVITERPLLTVRRCYSRPAVESVRRFVGAATVHLVDAMAGRSALGYEIKAVDPTASGFTGPALTCQARADDTLAFSLRARSPNQADVVIAATEDFRGSAGVGDLFAAMVRRSVWRPS